MTPCENTAEKSLLLWAQAMIRRRRFESASHHHPERGIIILSLDGSPERRAPAGGTLQGYMDRDGERRRCAVSTGFDSWAIHHPGPFAVHFHPGTSFRADGQALRDRRFWDSRRPDVCRGSGQGTPYAFCGSGQPLHRCAVPLPCTQGRFGGPRGRQPGEHG